MRYPPAPRDRDDRGASLPRRDDRGAAMILVMIWCSVLLMLSAVLAQGVADRIRPSDRSEKYLAAEAAAEAGIDDYRARLLVDNRYFLRTDATNTSLTGWVPVPGGAGNGEFTIAVDATRALRAGELRIISTGRVDGAIRTVEALLTKRSTLDYVYISDFETMAPSLPGAYADPTLAASLCRNRYWKDTGLVSKSGVSPQTGLHRNSQYCRWAGIFNSERIKGRIHTNDVWYLATDIPNIDPMNTGGSSSAVFDGQVTTSCPLPTGSTAGCPANQRWIATSSITSNPSPFAWSSSTLYKTTELVNSWPNKAWNPAYDTVLEIPASNSRMKELAEDRGCMFTGPTRIRLRPNFTIEVTSPDTRQTSAMCGGTSLYANPATPAVQPTVTLSLSTMTNNGFNGVIYVQGTTSAAAPNNWSLSSTPATCAVKTTGATDNYPFVIPSLEASDIFKSSWSGRKGFPSAQIATNPSAASWYDCRAGDLFIQGEFSGALTLAADNNIGLTGHIVDTNVTNKTTPNTTTYGVPPLTSDNMIGLVPTQFLYAYRPLRTVSGSLTETDDWDSSKTRNVIYDFATVVLNACFGAQDATFGANLGSIYLRGSLGQRYRCPVGTTGGSGTAYAKSYQHDQRFAVEDPPPYMLELSNEPWKVKGYSQTTIRRDPIATTGLVADTGAQLTSTTRSYSVLANDVAGVTLIGARVLSGSGTATYSGSQVTYTSTATMGAMVIEYTVRKPDGTRAAQTLTVTVS